MGFSVQNAGLTSSLSLIGGLIGAPFWSFIADKYKIHKFITYLLCIVAITAL